VEGTFQTEKGLAGLDEHRVRRYPPWSRWFTLAMLAHALLAVVRADEHTRRSHGLTAARAHRIIRIRERPGVATLADLAYRGAGRSSGARRTRRREAEVLADPPPVPMQPQPHDVNRQGHPHTEQQR
jgi:hypothetical protein